MGGERDGYFWPLRVLIAVLVPLLRNGWALYGPDPDPDLDKVEGELDTSSRHRERHAERQAGRSNVGTSARGERAAGERSLFDVADLLRRYHELLALLAGS